MLKSPNPALKRLGYSNNDRVVIVHMDDIGMCQATLDVYPALKRAGTVSSGAVMVPCPWFLEAAEYAVANPQADLGVHLTVTSEWKNYRWGPISTTERSSGLIDEQGYFYRRYEVAQAHARPEAVAVELEAQIRRALAAGMQPTHVDTHMFTLLYPGLLEVYLRTAYRFGLPAMMVRWNAAEWQQRGFSSEAAAQAERLVQELEGQGYPLLDSTSGLKLDRFDPRLEYAQGMLARLPAGLHHFYLHPSADTPELRAITPDWPGRVADYETFLDPAMAAFLQAQGFAVIGYRPLLGLMPAGA